jgi:hypothetical protein
MAEWDETKTHIVSRVLNPYPPISHETSSYQPINCKLGSLESSKRRQQLRGRRERSTVYDAKLYRTFYLNLELFPFQSA